MQSDSKESGGGPGKVIIEGGRNDAVMAET